MYQGSAKGPTPNTIILGIRFSMYEIGGGGDRNIQTIALCLHLVSIGIIISTLQTKRQNSNSLTIFPKSHNN